MRAGLLAFCLAVIATTQLLTATLSSLVIVVLLVLCLVSYPLLPRGWRWPLAAVLGLVWASYNAQSLIEQQLPVEAGQTDAYLELFITGVPEQGSNYTLFHARVNKVIEGEVGPDLGGLLRLRWYSRGAAEQAAFPGATQKHQATHLEAGQTWRLRLRLRPPDGFLNPAGFDYQRWLFVRQITATGHVRTSTDNRLIEARPTIHTWRTRIAQSMAENLPASAQLGLVQGLGVAVREGISDEHWQILSHTGTAHLLAISGMHIGMVAATFGWLFATCWRCIPPLVRRVPALIAGTLAGVSAAAGYAALAGFTLPTQRALVMVCVFALALVMRRSLQPWHSFILAAAAVLIIDPWAPLGAGFWLSFGAVAVILLATQGRLLGNGLWPWLRLQGVVGIALLPATALWFNHLPWLSPVANWIAVPWVSFAVVPLVLIGVVLLPLSDPLAGLVWQAADISLAGLMAVLGTLEAQLGSYTISAAPRYFIVLASVGVLYLLAPRGLPGRWLALPLMFSLLLIPANTQKQQTTAVMFDTGGAMAFIVHAGGEAVVYGLGPGGGLDGVSVALEPYVEQHGLRISAWIVPREGDLWSGALGRAQRTWQQVTWIDNPYDCANWRTELGSLSLATRVTEQGCSLRLTGEAGVVNVTPHLPLGTSKNLPGTIICPGAEDAVNPSLEASLRHPRRQDPHIGANDCSREVFRGASLEVSKLDSDQLLDSVNDKSSKSLYPQYLIGLRDCTDDYEGEDVNPVAGGGCDLALARLSNLDGELEEIASTSRDGAITFYPEEGYLQPQTEVERRGRVFHRQSREGRE
ncbi:DNA internalization-related competence protein ComEC/Rec2 [Halorhodospira halochloris]|uniref:DNA internalization-related competence protein ComEC/Rec2 n=1 Tax=Halorhodospira halochloris TaxID=1052 RepID=A0A0X8XAQ7_HALHR|nr:DNA internalization-related competence protein ComEC/Rec2 [Halorhodospira halochloris]MBK1652058.1 DNA internalization-related competence protein ComEC/Rec2 [Halorhodospira halochloris]BAU57978.1 DNA internalization-related competence protein ComEC/Rec2 [Halorhodospira halochloris]